MGQQYGFSRQTSQNKNLSRPKGLKYGYTEMSLPNGNYRGYIARTQ